jgi:hypothetical protein
VQAGRHGWKLLLLLLLLLLLWPLQLWVCCGVAAAPLCNVCVFVWVSCVRLQPACHWNHSCTVYARNSPQAWR